MSWISPIVLKSSDSLQGLEASVFVNYESIELNQITLDSSIFLEKKWKANSKRVILKETRNENLNLLFKVRNDESVKMKKFFLSNIVYLSEYLIYQIDDGGVKEISSDKKVITSLSQLSEFEISRKSEVIFLVVTKKKGPLYFNFKIGSVNDYFDILYDDISMVSYYTSGMIFAFTLALIGFILSKQKILLFYAFSVLSVGLTEVVLSGVHPFYLDYEVSTCYKFLYTFLLCSFLSQYFFYNEFLSIKKYSRLFYRFISIIMVAGILTCIAQILFVNEFWITIAQLLVLIFTGSYLAYALVGVVFKNEYAKDKSWIFILSFSPLIISGQLYVLSEIGLLYFINKPIYIMLFGSCLEFFIFGICLCKQIFSYINELNEIEKEKKLVDQAKQIAHDLSSPIMALEQVATNYESLGNDGKELLESISERIKGISNKIYSPVVVNEKNNIAGLLKNIVLEKKQELSNRNVKIEVFVPKDEVLVEIDGIEFKRVISNLINNSVDSCEKNNDFGQVNIHLFQRTNWAVIEIKDNGTGFNEKEIKKVFEKGFSDKGTQGLGLFHAKNTIIEVGGSIEVENTQIGAKVSVVLPLARNL